MINAHRPRRIVSTDRHHCRAGRWLGDATTAQLSRRCDRTQQRHQATTSAAWSEFAVPLIGKHQSAHPVVALHGAPAEQPGKTDCQRRLEHPAGGEIHAAAQINHQQHRPLALLDEQLGVGTPGTGGDIPVDHAHIVTGLVLTHLGEIQPAPETSRYRCADRRRCRRPPSQAGQGCGRTAQTHQLRKARLDRGVERRADAGTGGRASGRPDHGTAMVFSSASTTAVAVMPSASASNERIRRCRSTSCITACTSAGET